MGNRKLDNGNLCKKCAGKLSPWFEERRHSTVDDIKEQLAYREENKNAVRNFKITREFSGDRYHVFIDDNKGMFAVAFNMSEQNNPDIVPLSAITLCRLEIDEQREEEEYTEQDGETRSYVPPRYTYSYDYKIKLSVNTPWFDDMDFRLHNFSIEQDDRAEIMEIERAGYEIVSALTGQAPMGMQGMNGMPVNNGMNYGMQGMNGMPMNNSMQGMNGMPMNNSMQGMNSTQMNNSMPVNNGMQGNQQMQQPGGTWKCQCGAENKGKFCEYCGQPRPF